MKKIILILLLIPFFGISQTSDYQLDSKTPENVVNALFYVALSQDFTVLGQLCDPEGEGDGDTQQLCALSLYNKVASAGDNLTRENFTLAFINGSINGETIYTSQSSSVPILFMQGNKTETINLIKREGKWYLSSF